MNAAIWRGGDRPTARGGVRARVAPMVGAEGGRVQRARGDASRGLSTTGDVTR